MNDDQLLREVGSWLMDADPEPPDARDSVRQAMARKPRLRQRGRWWPLPVLRRATDRPAMDQMAAFQPDPITATNGHIPATITGRTRTMFSPAKAIAAGALIFGIGSALLIAQPFQQASSVPGAETEATDDGAAAQSSALVTGRRYHQSARDFTENTDMATIWAQRGRVTVAQSAMSDPRLSGHVVIMDDADRFFEDTADAETFLGDILWGTVEITNDGGAWTGTSVGTTDNLANGGNITYYELVGSGGYEGLSAVIFEREADGWSWSGAVFPGDLPPDRQ